MRVLVIFSHPVETSYQAALHAEVVQQLRGAGHEVDDCDLYAEGFNPVMSREERLGYHEVPHNRLPVQRYVDRLLWAEAVVFCFPTWCFGLPAMLKGFFDRVLMMEGDTELGLLLKNSLDALGPLWPVATAQEER